MKLLVCGSRTWTDYETIYKAIDSFRHFHRYLEVIHGGARGADTLAGRACKEMKLPVKVYEANWKELGKFAGLKRNLEMLDTEPDLVLAFQLGGSKGTQHTIDEARRRNIPVEVYSGEVSLLRNAE